MNLVANRINKFLGQPLRFRFAVTKDHGGTSFAETSHNVWDLVLKTIPKLETIFSRISHPQDMRRQRHRSKTFVKDRGLIGSNELSDFGNVG